MDTYESVLEQISALQKAATDNSRDIRWISGTSTLGAARDEAGRLEIFLVGPRLTPFSRALRDTMHHHDWHRATGSVLRANRLLLPALGHFDHVAAFICTELLRNGVKHSASEAFRKTEPIIELALKRLEMTENSILGLTGELLVLDALVHQAPDTYVEQALQSWAGWQRSKRDFVWNKTGVEVKTTRNISSSHPVQGIHQVDTYPDIETDVEEERLLLISIGLLDAEPGGHTLSIPQLVERILGRLEAFDRGSLREEFVQHVAEYGSEAGFGYKHSSMSQDAPFTNVFGTTFCRAYDMKDPSIHVIRHETIARFSHVDPGSVKFTVNLPPVLSSENPVQGINRIAQLILA